MKRDREGTEAPAPAAAAGSRAVLPPPPPPSSMLGYPTSSNGGLRIRRTPVGAASNGKVTSTDAAAASKSNGTNNSTGSVGAGVRAAPAPQKPRAEASAALGAGGIADSSSGVNVHPSQSSQLPQSPSPSAINVSSVSAVTGSSSSGGLGYSNKRPKFGVITEPEGWREVAEAIIRADKEGSGRIAEGDDPIEAGGCEGEQVDGGADGGEGLHWDTGLPMATSRRKFSVVCSANFNRSMMAHKFLRDNRFRVESYGTGRDVRLPGKDHNSPEIFSFGTPYLDIYDTLRGKDEDFFRRNNLLGLVARNASIKPAPQRFQDIGGAVVAGFDVVLCFDSRVFYLVVEDLQSRDPELFKPLHVVNMTIKDSPEESALAAGDVLELCKTLDGMTTLEEEAARYLESFAKRTKRTILHQVCHV